MTDVVTYRLDVNGVGYEVRASPARTLLSVLRDDLRLTGTKYNCEQGECGACTVLLDRRPVTSCLVLGVSASGHDVVTIEGVGSAAELHPVQLALVAHDAAQCGYCTPGMVMSAIALLEHDPSPSRSDIEEALAGNYCRCTGYEAIVTAIQECAVSSS